MPLFCDNLIIGGKKEEIKKSPSDNSWNDIHHKLQKAEEKTHYEVVKEGDLVKHHNLKSEYLNDMTSFKN